MNILITPKNEPNHPTSPRREHTLSTRSFPQFYNIKIMWIELKWSRHLDTWSCTQRMQEFNHLGSQCRFTHSTTVESKEL